MAREPPSFTSLPASRHGTPPSHLRVTSDLPCARLSRTSRLPRPSLLAPKRHYCASPPSALRPSVSPAAPRSPIPPCTPPSRARSSSSPPWKLRHSCEAPLRPPCIREFNPAGGATSVRLASLAVTPVSSNRRPPCVPPSLLRLPSVRSLPPSVIPCGSPPSSVHPSVVLASVRPPCTSPSFLRRQESMRPPPSRSRHRLTTARRTSYATPGRTLVKPAPDGFLPAQE